MFEARWIDFKFLLAGTVLSFLLCCAAGRIAVSHNMIRPFTYFSVWLSSPTSYYPTFMQVLGIAKDSVNPDKIVVIVAGSSTMRGHGQNPNDVWTKYLQQELGSEYDVLNLAIDGGRTNDLGTLVAENLLSDCKRIILVTDLAALNWDVDGSSRYNYVFWDGYYRHMLRSWPERERRLHEIERIRANSSDFQNIKVLAALNTITGMADLWNTICYQYFDPIYREYPPWFSTPNLPFWAPRRLRQEPFVGEDYKAHPSSEDVTRWLADLRRTDRTFDEYTSKLMRERIAFCFAPELRRKTIVVFQDRNPLYVRMMTDDERQFRKTCDECIAKDFESYGMNPLLVGDVINRESLFFDQLHFLREGGILLAKKTAGKVQEVSKELGYVQ